MTASGCQPPALPTPAAMSLPLVDPACLQNRADRNARNRQGRVPLDMCQPQVGKIFVLMRHYMHIDRACLLLLLLPVTVHLPPHQPM